MSTVFARAKRLVPVAAKDAVKRALRRAPQPLAVRGVATTTDLYVWLVGSSMDTVVPVHNWYSVFFPEHDTATSAVVRLLDDAGGELAVRTVAVAPFASEVLSVADVLGLDRAAPLRCGTLTWHLEAPAGVHEHVLAGADRFVFWDRSYIGYRGAGDHVAWVHGVDKHEILGAGFSLPWPLGGDSFVSSPEIPVDLTTCESFDVLVQNRDARPRTPTLVVTAPDGASIEQRATIPPRGVHRFEVSDPCRDLGSAGLLRLRVDDLPTRYGRPIVLRRFPGGTFSLMHC